MALINTSVLNIINKVCDFFTEISDIPMCTDPVINARMREIMYMNPTVNRGILEILTELVKNMRVNPQFDHYDLEQFDMFSELVTAMSIGWFNYDKYIGQYSEHEIGDLVFMKIQEVISNEAERLHIQYSTDSLDTLLNTLRI